MKTKMPRCSRPLRTGNVCDRPAGHKGCHNGQTFEVRATLQKARRRSPKGRAAVKAYAASPKGRAVYKAYVASPKGRAYRKAYDDSPKRRMSHTMNTKKRKALKRGATVDPFTAKELATHIEAMGGRCVYCDGPYEHLDHVYPLSKGGPHALSNLVPACAACNMRKHDMLPLQWLLNTETL